MGPRLMLFQDYVLHMCDQHDTGSNFCERKIWSDTVLSDVMFYCILSGVLTTVSLKVVHASL